MKRLWRGVLVLGALQLGLVGLYLGVEARRTAPAPFAVEALDLPAPSLVVERGGEVAALPDGPHVVHFWATWCGPCQEELPALLAAAEDTGAPLVAVTDEPWSVVRAWFGGQVPAAVVRDPSGLAASDWQVSGLPDTFVVSDGRLIARMGGPRDWSTPTARRYLRQVTP